MRSVAIVMVLLLGVVTSASADDKALAKQAGRLVISPDAPPATLGELADYLAANVATDGAYEALKGPPWTVHVVSWLAKPAKEVTIVIADPADPKTLLLDIAVTTSAKQKLVATKLHADQATGFQAGKTYVVRMMLGKKQLAKASLRMRE